MIIGIWIFTVICLVILVGEIKYRYSMHKGSNLQNDIFCKSWADTIDVDIHELSIEKTSSGFVDSDALEKRGSWRVAQDKVMGKENFDEMRNIEYCKKL